MKTKINNIAHNLLTPMVAVSIALLPLNHRVAAITMLLGVIISIIQIVTGEREQTSRLVSKMDFVLLLLIFLAMIFLGVLYHGNVGAFDNYSRLLILIPIFIALSNGIKNKEIVLVAIVFAVLWMFFQALKVQLSEEGVRATLGYKNAIPLSNLAAEFGTILLLYALASDMKRPYKLFLGFIVALALLSVFLTGTKGALLPFVLIGATVYLLSPIKIYQKLIWILVVVVLAIAADILSSGLVSSRFSNAWDGLFCFARNDWLQCDDGSVGVRVWMWIVALWDFASNPWVGSGPGSYQMIMQSYIASGEVPARFAYLNNPHNDALKLMQEFGIWGLISYLVLCYGLLRFSIRLFTANPLAQPWRLIFLGHLVFMILLGLTQSVFSVSSMALLFAFMTMLLAAFAYDEAIKDTI